MTGSKTNEQLHRQLERKPDVGEARQRDGQRQDHAGNRAGKPKSADDKGQNIAQNTRNQGYQQDR